MRQQGGPSAAAEGGSRRGAAAAEQDCAAAAVQNPVRSAGRGLSIAAAVAMAAVAGREEWCQGGRGCQMGRGGGKIVFAGTQF